MEAIEEVSELLRRKKLRIAIAESCTGGFLSHVFTNLPGASDFFVFGVVVYSPQAKKKFLFVKEESLAEPVSAKVAEEMCLSVKNLANAEIGLSTTGYLPTTKEIPHEKIGIVFTAIAGKQLHVFENKFSVSSRIDMKKAIADFVIQKLLEIVRKEF